MQSLPPNAPEPPGTQGEEPRPARENPPHVTQPGEAAPPRENLALLVAYDGSAYQGWQVQPHGPSVQGRLEEALRIVTRHEARVYGSGRTDAGVHALGQVANVWLPAGQDRHRLRARLNGLLGPNIVVRAIVPVAENFHARHRARGKHYRYRLCNRPYPPLFTRTHSWWIRRPLDVAAMHAAAAPLLGEHDFSAFRARDCEAAHPVRTLTRLDVAPRDEPDCTLALELEANAFLQHMARIIAGTLVDVGLGKLAPQDVAHILAGGRREDASATAPPGGLHLVRVNYDLAAYPALAAFAEA